jgi:uncharacterized protein YigE (DUF2233 family)
VKLSGLAILARASLLAVGAAVSLVACVGGSGAGTLAPGEVTPPAADASASASLPTAAQALRTVEHNGRSFDVVTLPLDDWEVRVEWLEDPDGSSLTDVQGEVRTNAGIFTPEYVPGGLLVTDGQELVPLNLNSGSGNFHLTPNGVFLVREDGTAAVVNSTAYLPDGVRFATQSGPALVLDGAIHPEFREGSSNIARRNGVGVTQDGKTVLLAISNEWVNLHDFATLFRDTLGAPNALYLDGQISGLWVQGGGRDLDLIFGPYAGVITAHQR